MRDRRARPSLPGRSHSRSPRGRGAACESRCSAIHPEIPLCGIEGLRPSLPGRKHTRSAQLPICRSQTTSLPALRFIAGAALFALAPSCRLCYHQSWANFITMRGIHAPRCSRFIYPESLPVAGSKGVPPCDHPTLPSPPTNQPSSAHIRTSRNFLSSQVAIRIVRNFQKTNNGAQFKSTQI